MKWIKNEKPHRFQVLSLAVCLLFIFSLSAPLNIATAATGFVVTNGAGGEGTNAWTNPANARGTNNDNYATARPLPTQTISGIWNAYNFDSNLPLHADITKVQITAQYRLNASLEDMQLHIQALVNGAGCPSTPFVDNTRPISDFNVVADVTSCRDWQRNDLLNANFATKISAYHNGLLLDVTDFLLDFVTVSVTYSTPDYNQVAYRWFDNTDSTAVGTALANQDTAPTLYAPRDRVRLRLLLHVTTANLLTNSETFKLQFAQKGTSCAASSYADVTTTSLIAHYDNPSVTTNSLLTTNGGDPTHGTDTVIAQSYSDAGNFNTLANVNIGQDGLWDVSLVGNGMLANTPYCLRAVTSNGNALTGGYSVYPELVSSAAGGLTVDIVDGSGVPVATPQFAFGAMISPIDCAQNTTTLGSNSQRVRLKNTTDSPSWTVSIAATDGSTALWSSGTPKYDFNDGSGSPAGCSSGLDGDTYGGQMIVDASVGTITPRSVNACTTSGLSKGGSAAFAEGTLNAITLLTASSTADSVCYWDLTGVAVKQQIPGGQQPGNYSINLTLTVLAS